MSANSNILQKAQQAFAAHLRTLTFSGLPATNIFCGIGRGLNTGDPATEVEQVGTPVPCIVVECRTATAQANFSGCWGCEVRIEVRDSADDVTEEAHLERAGAVFNSIMDDGIAAALTAALADWTAFLVVPESQSYEIDRRHWRSYLTVSVECAGSDIS